MSEIVILGVFVADAAYRVDRLPVVGETLLGNSFELGPGGKGSNQAVAAAKAGGEVSFISRIGRDTFGQMGTDIWRAAGVTPLVTEDPDAPTGSAGIFIEDGSGRNAIVIAPGAAGRIGAEDVEARAAQIGQARVAMTQLEHPLPAAQRFLEIAAGGQALTILNPAPATNLPPGMLALCDYVTPNETEAEALSGVPVSTVAEAQIAAKALMQMGVRKGVIVTLGENGSLYWDGQAALHVPPMSAGPAVDTTGAGDAFNGGLATALASGASIAEALRFATATAALSVTRHGTAASMPGADEITALIG